MRGDAGARVYHCRTHNGRYNTHLVVETDDERVFAQGAGASAEVTREDPKHLP